MLLTAAAAFYVVNTQEPSPACCACWNADRSHKWLSTGAWSVTRYYLAGALLAVAVQSIAGLPLVPLVLLLPLLIAHVVYRGYMKCQAEATASSPFTGREVQVTAKQV